GTPGSPPSPQKGKALRPRSSAQTPAAIPRSMRHTPACRQSLWVLQATLTSSRCGFDVQPLAQPAPSRLCILRLGPPLQHMISFPPASAPICPNGSAEALGCTCLALQTHRSLGFFSTCGPPSPSPGRGLPSPAVFRICCLPCRTPPAPCDRRQSISSAPHCSRLHVS